MCTPSGHYRPPWPAPVMQVTAITHRANPVFPAMVYGPPPHEATVIERALCRMFLPLVRMAIPELVDCDLPACGAARHWAVLAIRKTYAGQARRVAAAAWAVRPLMFAKMLAIVDEGTDVRDWEQVLAAIASHVAPERDAWTFDGPADPLDPAAPLETLARRMAVDATRKLPGETSGPLSAPAAMSDEVLQLVSRRWPEYGLGQKQ